MEESTPEEIQEEATSGKRKKERERDGHKSISLLSVKRGKNGTSAEKKEERKAVSSLLSLSRYGKH